MTARQILVVIGTRPEAIKLAPVVLELEKPSYGLRAVLCTTGQHRDLVNPVLSWFGIAPEHDLQLMRNNQDPADFASRALAAMANLLREQRPGLVLVQGDTTTAMAAALAAFYAHIPVAHVEAGLRTGRIDSPFPEEMNRRVISILAKHHFAPTAGAQQALLREHVPAHQVFLVGNTVVDALHWTLRKLAPSALTTAAAGGKRILMTAHRRESFGAPFESLCMAVSQLVNSRPELEVMFPVHPNPNVQDPVNRLLAEQDRIQLLPPMRYEEFVHAMAASHLILTDSGGVQEEASALGKPTLVLRDNTERGEAVSAGTAMLVGTATESIVAAVERLLDDANHYRTMARASTAFGDGHAAARIAQILSEQLSATV